MAAHTDTGGGSNITTIRLLPHRGHRNRLSSRDNGNALWPGSCRRFGHLNAIPYHATYLIDAFLVVVGCYRKTLLRESRHHVTFCPVLIGTFGKRKYGGFTNAESHRISGRGYHYASERFWISLADIFGFHIRDSAIHSFVETVHKQHPSLDDEFRCLAPQALFLDQFQRVEHNNLGRFLINLIQRCCSRAFRGFMEASPWSTKSLTRVRKRATALTFAARRMFTSILVRWLAV